MRPPAARRLPSQSAIERRTEERIPAPVDVEILVSGGQPELAVLRDISSKGIGLQQHSRLPIGEVITCTLLDTPVELPSRYRVEVLWQKEASDGTYFSGGRILTADCGQ